MRTRTSISILIPASCHMQLAKKIIKFIHGRATFCSFCYLSPSYLMNVIFHINVIRGHAGGLLAGNRKDVNHSLTVHYGGYDT